MQLSQQQQLAVSRCCRWAGRCRQRDTRRLSMAKRCFELSCSASGAPRSARTGVQVRHYACVYQAAACVLQSSPIWAGRCQTLWPSCIGGFAGLAQHDTGPVTECGFFRYVWAAKEAYPQTYFREPVIACLACTGDQAGVVYGSAHGQFRQGGAGRGQFTAP